MFCRIKIEHPITKRIYIIVFVIKVHIVKVAILYDLKKENDFVKKG